MTNHDKLERIRGGLIVSCQALETEPLHCSYIMSRMAYAAMLGGAVGIRANTIVDIQAIKTVVKDLPIIGIIKTHSSNSKVYITPTKKEIDELVSEGVDIIAMDATNRVRPCGSKIFNLFPPIRSEYKEQLFMADCSCYEDAVQAEELGFDLIGTTLCRSDNHDINEPAPNYYLIQKLTRVLHKPIVAEGGIWSPKQFRTTMDLGVHTCVVGSAITRPLEITQRFVSALNNE